MTVRSHGGGSQAGWVAELCSQTYVGDTAGAPRHLPRAFLNQSYFFESDLPLYISFLSYSTASRYSASYTYTIWQRAMGYSLRILLHHRSFIHSRIHHAENPTTSGTTFWT